jgi:hypothetical protein
LDAVIIQNSCPAALPGMILIRIEIMMLRSNWQGIDIGSRAHCEPGTIRELSAIIRSSASRQRDTGAMVNPLASLF